MTSTEVPPPETLFGVDDDLATPRCSEWLAAYALGLSHTTSSPHDAVDDLVATARGSHHLLREAREHLARLTHVDHDLLARTGQLLTAAVAASRQASIRSPTNDHARRPKGPGS